MPATLESIPDDVHRQCAKALFNHTWTLLETPERTTEQDDEMLHAAFASRFHWGRVGEPVQFARGEWQIARVFAVLERPAEALHHAKRCLDLCDAHGLGDFDVAFAHEAAARALSVAGHHEEAAEQVARGLAAAQRVVDAEERKAAEDDLRSIGTGRG